jgi:hypothetical protein
MGRIYIMACQTILQLPEVVPVEAELKMYKVAWVVVMLNAEHTRHVNWVPGAVVALIEQVMVGTDPRLWVITVDAEFWAARPGVTATLPNAI